MLRDVRYFRKKISERKFVLPMRAVDFLLTGETSSTQAAGLPDSGREEFLEPAAELHFRIGRD
jgi:hypothetical protein